MRLKKLEDIGAGHATADKSPGLQGAGGRITGRCMECRKQAQTYRAWVKAMTRLMKLPRLFRSSLLVLAAKSVHLKTESDCSGRLASR